MIFDKLSVVVINNNAEDVIFLKKSVILLNLLFVRYWFEKLHFERFDNM